ncbi:hypothetical protein KP509_34G070200 [Ceratopteris richardii]|nr:hypothetical protein KP509_34G070200 [Ceratopteris richardii]
MEIHAHACLLGLAERDRFLCSTLVDMYAKCGSMSEAWKIFNHLSAQDAVAWTALIKGYADNGDTRAALETFNQMQTNCVAPDAVTYVCCVKACGSIHNQNDGHKLHTEVESKGLLANELNLGNALVDMYAKSGALSAALHVFERLAVRDVVSWTALIGGYAEDGQGAKALQCFEEMQIEGVQPNAATFVCSLKASSCMKNLSYGLILHSEIERRKLLQNDHLLGNTLIDMYVKCGSLHLAQAVFGKLHIQDVVAWTTLIMGYAEQCHSAKALELYEQMKRKGIQPNTATFLCTLKACATSGDLDNGQNLHSYIKAEGLLGEDSSLGTSLIGMYAKAGLFIQAHEVFDSFSHQDAVSWNALITGYIDYGHEEKVFQLFEQMQIEGILGDPITYLCIFRACAGVASLSMVQKLHVQVSARGLFNVDSIMGTALLDAYAKCGNLVKAQAVFDELPTQDVVSCTALVACYVEHGCWEEALNCFDGMQLKGVSPNIATLICGLKCCGASGALDRGKELHIEIERRCLLQRDPAIGNTLVDMYSKCGVLPLAQEVFDSLLNQDVVTWNSLIAGYVQKGKPAAPFLLIDRMLERTDPNPLTFLIILSVCNRMGFLNLNQTYFDTMSKDFGIVPGTEHQISMIHLLCRAGNYDKAIAMINDNTYPCNFSKWRTLLNACKFCANIEVGREVFEKMVKIHSKSGRLQSHTLTE